MLYFEGLRCQRATSLSMVLDHVNVRVFLWRFRNPMLSQALEAQLSSLGWSCSAALFSNSSGSFQSFPPLAHLFSPLDPYPTYYIIPANARLKGDGIIIRGGIVKATRRTHAGQKDVAEGLKSDIPSNIKPLKFSKISSKENTFQIYNKISIGKSKPVKAVERGGFWDRSWHVFFSMVLCINHVYDPS